MTTMIASFDHSNSTQGPISDSGADWAIRVNRVSKAYRTYPRPLDLLKEVISGKARHEERWVLRDISFEVPRGSIVGIIGPNGAGKSTLLKIVAGVLNSTTGTAEIRGRVSAILELGTGFHPDFTGRQNIITGGMCLGMTRSEVEERQNWIIDFSELHSVIDRPFKTYSSGMQARLTFATAVSIDPEIFIVDEALAAGDAYFVSKCIKRIHKICSSGATVLFVSHGTNQVAQMCSTAIWLQDGRIRGIGLARDIARQYDYEVHVRISNNTGRTVQIPAELEAADPERLKPPSRVALETAAASPEDQGIPVAEAMAKETNAAPNPEIIPTAFASQPDDESAAAGGAAEISADDLTSGLPAEGALSAVKDSRRGPVFIEKVVFRDGSGEPCQVFRTWDAMRIDVHYTCHGEIPEGTLGLRIGIERESDPALITQFGTILPAGTETQAYADAPFRRQASKCGVISAVFPSLQMMNGDFLVSVGLLPNIPDAVDFYEFRHRGYKLRVIAAGYPSGAAFYPLVEWEHKT
jgi:ABC-type polysaccharide/polyol phosphate transport system ATPase subunit